MAAHRGGWSAPLGPHWTWTFKRGPGPIVIAEAQPDGFVQLHYALLGRSANRAGNSASFFAECLVEGYGTPGW